MVCPLSAPSDFSLPLKASNILTSASLEVSISLTNSHAPVSPGPASMTSQTQHRLLVGNTRHRRRPLLHSSCRLPNARQMIWTLTPSYRGWMALKGMGRILGALVRSNHSAPLRDHLAWERSLSAAWIPSCPLNSIFRWG